VQKKKLIRATKLSQTVLHNVGIIGPTSSIDIEKNSVALITLAKQPPLKSLWFAQGQLLSSFTSHRSHSKSFANHYQGSNNIFFKIQTIISKNFTTVLSAL
jgi:hypothetical protein